MDNCCTCSGGSIVNAAVLARFLWPGFPRFDTMGPSADTFNVRYLTATVTVPSGTGTVTKILSSNNLNSTFNDTVTGTDASAGTWVAFGNQGAAWPPDTISPDGTTASWASGQTIVLSDPIDASWCKTQAQNLLDSVDLYSLTPGTDSKIVTYDAVFSGSGTASWQRTSNDYGGTGGDSWPMLCVCVGPGPGFAVKYAWGDAQSGAIYTADAITDATFTPFESVTPAMTVSASTSDIPPSASSLNLYAQEDYWQMRKSLSTPCPSPVCCEDDYYNYVHATPPPTVCQMIANDGMGNLVLTPPALTFDVTDNSHMVIRTPWFGTALTGGGCPCA